jgi:hypothetical protein
MTKQGRGWEKGVKKKMVEKSCRRIRAAEERSAPPTPCTSPTTNGAAVGIADIQSQGRKAFLPLGISLW